MANSSLLSESRWPPGITFHCVPSQCSISTRCPPLMLSKAPTAQASLAGVPMFLEPSVLLPAPPNTLGGQAVALAYRFLGVPYVWGGATPLGFDCSGLTMWAWAHAGVSLPHSSAMQYAVLPHVDRSQLQPGDLLFFYSPIHHVAIYLGHGRMIHAPHTGDHVRIQRVYWQYFVGAARP